MQRPMLASSVHSLLPACLLPSFLTPGRHFVGWCSGAGRGAAGGEPEEHARGVGR